MPTWFKKTSNAQSAAHTRTPSELTERTTHDRHHCEPALAAVAGRPRPAALVLSSAAVLLGEIGARPPWLTSITDQALSAIRAQLDEAAFADAWEQGQTLSGSFCF